MKIEIQQTITGQEKIGRDLIVKLENGGVTLYQQVMMDGDPTDMAIRISWIDTAALCEGLGEAVKQVHKLGILGKGTASKADAPARQKPGRKPAVCGTHGKPYKECGCVRPGKGQAPVMNPEAVAAILNADLPADSKLHGKGVGAPAGNGLVGHEEPLTPLLSTDFIMIKSDKPLPCSIDGCGTVTPFAFVARDHKTLGVGLYPRCGEHAKVIPTREELVPYEPA